MRLNFNKIFQKKLVPENSFVINNDEKLKFILKNNRNTLKEIPTWLTSETLENSYYRYGVPNDIYNLLDLNVGDEVIYSDLICYYSTLLENINYLELGVSVGKNFWQLMNHFNNATLTGFDIENFNPVIKDKLIESSSLIWDTNPKSLRLEASSFKQYNYKSNTINYLAGDIWDENNWKKLKGNAFNIIFSDALHDPKALLWEYEMITKYDLLNKDFIFYWDDLNNGLDESFLKIAYQLRKKYKLSNTQIKLIKINGWLGENYPLKHDLGIITSLNLM